MLTTLRIISVSLCTISLTACMIDGTSQIDYPSNGYQNSPLYPEGYDNAGYYSNYREEARTQKNVSVPESYHVGAYRSPVAPKDVDKAWVAGQSPQAYTIELANDEKAARVAGTLQKAPKSERTAEVKYHQQGKVYYKGLYGSYPTQQAAQDALNALPDDVKKGSQVSAWGNIQDNLSE